MCETPSAVASHDSYASAAADALPAADEDVEAEVVERALDPRVVGDLRLGDAEFELLLRGGELPLLERQADEVFAEAQPAERAEQARKAEAPRAATGTCRSASARRGPSPPSARRLPR